jgi:hypothetical protein
MLPNWAESCLEEYCNGELPSAVVRELRRLPGFEDRVTEYKLAVWNEAQVEEYLKPGHGKLLPYQVKALERLPGWLETFIHPARDDERCQFNLCMH